MSGVDILDIDRVFRVADLDHLPLPELRALFEKAIDELKDEKYKFEEYECKLFTAACVGWCHSIISGAWYKQSNLHKFYQSLTLRIFINQNIV